ncbi:hypothetical protein NPIL_118031 [Nephila pilipes]|uniref:Uncharacterized protein n=1 Tax=Nephila pilipes TaxID=299642 RepID=A0A8X6MRU0_NEPPI|nr:hypothetical protein NPIL_118031 [Nephila pilipes]
MSFRIKVFAPKFLSSRLFQDDLLTRAGLGLQVSVLVSSLDWLFRLLSFSLSALIAAPVYLRANSLKGCFARIFMIFGLIMIARFRSFCRLSRDPALIRLDGYPLSGLSGASVFSFWPQVSFLGVLPIASSTLAGTDGLANPGYRFNR